MHKLAESVLAYIRKHDLLRPGDRVGAAVSGGADSVALLRILLELRSELGIVLSVVHLNHMLRASESDADEQFVRELANAYGLPLVAESRDVSAHAKEKKLSIETAARELRYEFFSDCLERERLGKIATAHTLDDQAETVLLKLIRGAGTRGMAGIYPRVELECSAEGEAKSIIRPLLATRRSDIESYLRDRGQAWREDSSNLDLHHTRNRIRHEILPLLQQLNPRVNEALSGAAEMARAEDELWTAEVQRHLAGLWTCSEASGRLRQDALHALPLAFRRRVLRAAAQSVGLELDFDQVEEVLALSRESATVALPDSWRARKYKRYIVFEKAAQASTPDYQYPVVVPGTVRIPEAGIAVDTALYTGSNQDQRYNPDHLLDAGLAAKGLIVRNWRPGDRFWPSHNKEPKKIKDLLQAKHVTGEQKRCWPVIGCGDAVLWVRGFGVGQEFQAKSAEGVLIRETSLSSPSPKHIEAFACSENCQLRTGN